MLSHVEWVHLRVVVSVIWQSITKTHTVAHLSHRLPAALSCPNRTSTHACSEDQSQRLSTSCAFWWCAHAWLYASAAYKHKRFVVSAYLRLRVNVHLWDYDFLRYTTQKNESPHTHIHVHTNTSPCHCITTHAQARASPPPPPFTMQHEHTPPAGTEEAEPRGLAMHF